LDYGPQSPREQIWIPPSSTFTSTYTGRASRGTGGKEEYEIREYGEKDVTLSRFGGNALEFLA
jgi:hypothetical protein